MMVTKEEAQHYVESLAADKILTERELLAAYQHGALDAQPESSKTQLTTAEVFAYVGGGVVFLGIVILVVQNWNSLSFLTRLLVTLGASVAAFVAGLLLGREKRTGILSQTAYLISSLLLPTGVVVVFDHAGLDLGSAGGQTLISSILFVTYLLSWLVVRRNLFVVFSLIAATWCYFGITDLAFANSAYLNGPDYNAYRILIAGLSYIVLGYAWAKGELSALTGFLYGFGTVGFLGAALALGGYAPNQNVTWELFFPVLIFSVLFLSVHTRSNTFLVWGTIFLMIYIFKITAEYFSSGLGWPLALVLAGLGMIGAGYGSLVVKRRYLKRT